MQMSDRWIGLMDIMESKADRIEALRALLDRLGAPDLSLAEATLLRQRLVGLLGPIDGASEPSQGVPARSRESGPTRMLACSVH